MRIDLINFGHFKEASFNLTDMSRDNGWGKTTLINAYVFALTGKTLSGFHAPRKGMPSDDKVSVTLYGFADFPSIRRVLDPVKGGTTLYIGGDVISQADFVRTLESEGIDLNLAVMCANVNVLTNPDLSSETLRNLLVATDALDADESNDLRLQLSNLRKLRTEAEKYSVLNITIPARTVEPLSEAEKKFTRDFEEMEKLANVDIRKTVCECCGREYEQSFLNERKVSKKCASIHVKKNEVEYKRIFDKRIFYNAETEKIAQAQFAIDAASNARKKLTAYDTQIKDIEERIMELDAKSISATLPEGLKVVTSQEFKTSKNTKSVCTLTYNDIPLKSINKAKRIEICVRLLHQARKTRGMENIIAIIVDNAESVQGLQDIPNLIRFSVG